MSPNAVTDTARAAERGPLSVVCAQISALIRVRWGRGPRRSRAYWAGSDALLVLLEDAHTESERTLLDLGLDAKVLDGRRTLSRGSHEELRQIVEEVTGRAVRAVLTESGLEPAVTALVFVFEPGERRASAQDERLGEALMSALETTNATRALRAENEQAMRTNAERRAQAAERSGRGGSRPDG